MKWISLAVLGWLTLLGPALAGPVKGTEVPTKLLPEPVEVVIPEPVPVVVKEKPPKECEWREKVTVSYSPSRTYAVPGMLVETCGCCGQKQVWIGGVYYQSSGEQLQAISFEEVCN